MSFKTNKDQNVRKWRSTQIVVSARPKIFTDTSRRYDSYMYNFILQFKVYNDNDKCKQAMFYVNDSQSKVLQMFVKMCKAWWMLMQNGL